MKQKLCGFFASFLCASALCIGLCFCFVTSFDVPVDVLALVLGGFCIALCASALFLWKRFLLGLAALLVLLLAGGIYFHKAVLQSALSLYAALSGHFLSAIPELPLPELAQVAGQGDATLALLFLSLLYALLSSWTVLRAKTILPLLLAAVPLLALCLIILQTPPAPWASVLVVGALALLLLTQLLRARQPNSAHPLMLWLAGPLAALMTLLAVLFPADEYQRAAWSDALQSTITTAAEQLAVFRRSAVSGQLQFTSPFRPSTLGSYLWDSSVASVDLSRLGPQRSFGQSVMRVRTDNTGPVYLRGASMAIYEDNHWKALDEAVYSEALQERSAQNALVFAQSTPLADSGTVFTIQIETDMKSGIYYTPYTAVVLPTDAEPYYDAYLKNPSQTTSYEIVYQSQLEARQIDAQYEAFAHEVYTQLPEQTRQTLLSLWQQVEPQPITVSDLRMRTIEQAMQAAAYVMQSARYDLDTATVPAGEDFASWFLLESESGYCVHFATAATLLLRALDIPARYVTGYCLNATAGEWTSVTSEDAHAWVEIYLDQIGWVRLEVTPSAQTQTQAQSTPTENLQKSEDISSKKPISAETTEKNTQKIIENEAKTNQNRSIFTYFWPILIVFFTLFFWRMTIFCLRRAAMHHGGCTRRTLVCYHHAEFLSRLRKQPVPQPLQELAEKVRFSPHKITRQELAPLLEYCEKQTAVLLSEKRIDKRFLYRVIFALG